MDCLDKVLEQLKKEGVVPSNNQFELEWPGNSGERHFIALGNIDCKEDKLAWFQSSDYDEHLLRVFENGNIFSWTPITHNPVFGCDCHLLEWYDEYLVFVYQEKHDVYICVYRSNVIKTFNFHGDQLERQGNIFLFETYGPEKENIRRLKLPELIEVEPIPRKQAEQEDLIPQNA